MGSCSARAPAGFWGPVISFLSALSSAGSLTNWKFSDVLFQVLFAATAATIASGALSERTRLRGYLFYSGLISIWIYPIAAHWVWQGGWLARLGAIDFAGASVVHSLAGWVSLAAVLVLGPRLGRFNRDGSPNAIAGHDFPLAGLGLFLMWLGWFGSNTGNTLLSPNSGIALIALNTFLAGAGGALGAMVFPKLGRGKPDAETTLKGVLSGLVSSAGGAAILAPLSAAVVGGIGGGLLCCFRSVLRTPENRRSGGGDFDPRSERSLGDPGGRPLHAGNVFRNEPRLPGERPVLRRGLGTSRRAGRGGRGRLFVGLPSGLRVLPNPFLFAGPAGLPEQERRGLDQEDYSLAAYPLFAEFQKKQDEILKRCSGCGSCPSFAKSASPCTRST